MRPFPPSIVLALVLVVPAAASACREPSAESPQAPGPGAAGTVGSGAPAPAAGAPVEAPPGMVAVPGGPFWMGCDGAVDPACGTNEPAYRRVELPAFFVDRAEVTADEYAACVRAGACTRAPSAGACNAEQLDRAMFGMNCVTWHQAKAYCAWVDKRLPTEAEWEKAARGVDGRIYPWGNDAPDAGGTFRANWGDGLSTLLFQRDGFEYDAPPGKFPSGASPFGAVDLAGNLAEWVDEASGDERIVRGGSWREPARRIRASARDSHPPDRWYDHVGFRCAR